MALAEITWRYIHVLSVTNLQRMIESTDCIILKVAEVVEFVFMVLNCVKRVIELSDINDLEVHHSST